MTVGAERKLSFRPGRRFHFDYNKGGGYKAINKINHAQGIKTYNGYELVMDTIFNPCFHYRNSLVFSLLKPTCIL